MLMWPFGTLIEENRFHRKLQLRGHRLSAVRPVTFRPDSFPNPPKPWEYLQLPKLSFS